MTKHMEALHHLRQTILKAVVLIHKIFIFVFNMGVRGAALATVLSQAVGAVWILHFLTGNKNNTAS